ncbi:PREDICTED: uncharacterized protein LOC107881371 [Prunus mume]|uniref:Uncharacterized protein LOC107881371 n=1 Tax=Prunus mume TaxID=102107 RepID=A0ABM1LSX0_PRUMU|nr:PREDICTED: uncharacterized protein LOC107881371 [Prunus mume]
MTYTALLAGFRRGPFLFHVNKFPPKSYENPVSEAYHRENGHTIDQCYELQDEIEALIRRGRLSRFVGEKKQAEQHENTPNKQPHATKDINVISGGTTLARDSNKARKEYAQRTPGGLEALSVGPGYQTPKSPKLGYSAITFNKEEEKGVVHPHDDPFIIQAEITNYCVKRVFIDTGSLVNIIFTSAFEHIEISREDLKPVVTPLLGFTEDSINSIGSVTLPLSLGTAPQWTTIYTTFLIVECLSAYNVILGRPALCYL